MTDDSPPILSLVVSPTTQPRKHVSSACDPCRVKRCKCDGINPCHTCSSSGDLCIYSHIDRRRHGRSSLKAVASADIGIPGSESHDANQANFEAFPEIFSIGSTSSHSRAHTSYGAHSLNATPAPTNIAVESRHGHTESPRLVEHAVAADVHDRPVSFRRLLPKEGSTSANSALGSNRSRHSARKVHCNRNNFGHTSVWRIQRSGYAVAGYAQTFGNLPFSNSIQSNGYAPSVQAQQKLNFSLPEYLIFPLLEVDDSPLGRVYTDFQKLGQRLIACGKPLAEVLDHGLIEVTLFYHERRPDDPVNAFSWACEMERSFQGMFPNMVCLAGIVLLGRWMRWLIQPTAENYAEVPAMIRPTRLQRTKPHPASIDILVFAAWRDRWIQDPKDFLNPLARAKLRLDWPRAEEEALIRDARSGRVFLSPEFVAHAVQPKHWLVGTSIFDDFPDTADTGVTIVPD